MSFGSITHDPLHPSPARTFPSSHCSPSSVAPFPQTGLSGIRRESSRGGGSELDDGSEEEDTDDDGRELDDELSAPRHSMHGRLGIGRHVAATFAQ